MCDVHSLAIFIATILLKSAKGWDHQTELSKHESQTDAAKGFGGRFGVDKDKQDKVRVYLCHCFSELQFQCIFVWQGRLVLTSDNGYV